VVVLQYVELCAYFFILFCRGLSKSFRAVAIISSRNGTESLEARYKSHEARSMLKKAKHKIQLNMVLGVLVCANLSIIYCILLSPIVNRHEECALRAIGGTTELVVGLRLGINWIVFFAAQAVCIQMIYTFLVSRRKKIEMASKARVNNSSISPIERSSVQGGEA
jgi:hypothetical protein